jgi:hypothetical protein
MLIATLQEAIRTAEIVRIRYFGGSTPGLERDIAPILISGETVQAHCLLTETVKTFSLSKMELAVAGQPSALALTTPTATTEPNYGSLQELVNENQTFLESLGWIVKLEDNCLSLHRTHKNGKLGKTPVITLRFEEYAAELVFDGDEITEQNVRLRERPWVVRGKNKDTVTFGLVTKASSVFKDRAKELAPGK